MTEWRSPCILCGYNGPRFYEPANHPCMKHGSERGALLAEIERLRAEARQADDEATRLANSDLATTEQVIRSLRAEIRILKQRLDCTYGDTPGLIHCPIDQPCAMHEAERLREAVKTGMHYLKGRYPVPVKEREVLAKMLSALGFEDTRAPDSVGALIGLRDMKEEP